MSNQEEEVVYSLNKLGLGVASLRAGVMLGRAASVGDMVAKGLGETAGVVAGIATFGLDIATNVTRKSQPFFGRLQIEGFNTAVTMMAVGHGANVIGVQHISFPEGIATVAGVSVIREATPGLALGPSMFSSPRRITQEDGE